MLRILYCFLFLFTSQVMASTLVFKSADIGKSSLSLAADKHFESLRAQYIERKSLDPETEKLKTLLSKTDTLKLQVQCRKKLSSYAPSAKWTFKQLIVTGTSDYHTLVLYLYALTYSAYETINDELFFIIDKTLRAAKSPIEKSYVQYLVKKRELGNIELPNIKQQFSKEELENYEKKLIATYPTTFSGTNIKSIEQTHSGQACVEFSHPIAENNKLKPQDVVRISPRTPGVSIKAQEDKICISGLAFGQDYEVTIKPGLVSKTGQVMKEPFKGHVLIQDRKPMVAFRERGHLLSKHGQQILPLVSTNIEKVTAKIISIPKRNLHSVLSDNSFLNDISYYNISRYRNNFGETIWDGSVDLKAQVNQLNTFGIPIKKMLQTTLGPGLYICQIQDADEHISNYEKAISTQWFIVSDLGITTLEGPDGLHVIVRSLQTGQPLKGARVVLVAKNNKYLHNTEVNSDGIAKIGKPLLRGKGGNQPLYISVQSKDGKDFNFSWMNNRSHDLTDRGDKGRKSSEDYEVYMYSDRGIYRPGETINLTAMIRDEHQKGMDNIPLTFVVIKPNGSEYSRTLSNAPQLGTHTLAINTSRSDTSGGWKVDVYADPKSPPLASHTFIVSDFVPALIEGEIESDTKIYFGNNPQTEILKVNYLYGAKASDLKAKATLRLIAALSPFDQWKSYVFGLSDKPFTGKHLEEISVVTDKNGQAKIPFTLTAPVDNYGMIALKNTIEISDISGRTKVVSKTTPYWHQDFAIGIEKSFAENAPYKGDAAFNIIAIDKDGRLLKKPNIKFTLVSEQTDYIWFKHDQQWKYEAVVSDTEVDTGTIDLNELSPTSLISKVKSGPYRLILVDPETKISSSIRFYAGWTYDDNSKSRPDKVKMILDKKEYAPGDIARITIKPPYAGKLMLFIAGKQLGLYSSKDISKEGLEIKVPLKKSNINSPGSYLYATVFKPGEKNKDKADRAIGMSWIKVDSSAHRLSVNIDAPAKIRSNTNTSVKLHIPEKPKTAFVQIMAVDEGVLQITNYKSPNPLDFFLSERAFNYHVRDDYNQIIATDGAKETSFNVGGGGSLDASASKIDIPLSSVKIVSLYSGPVQLDADGKADVALTIPEFAGKLRIMAVAWSEDKMGSNSHETTVRDPIVTIISTPRFLSIGDQTTGNIFIHNADAESGDYTVSVTTTEAITLTDKDSSTLTLSKDQKKKIPLSFTANKVGEASITVTVKGPGDVEYTRTSKIGIRNNKVPEIRQHFSALEPGKSFDLPSSITESLASVSKVRMYVDQFLPVPVQDVTKSLLDYPWGCLEQTTSQGYAILATKGDVAPAINRLKSLQHFQGFFVTWPGTNQRSNWLSGYAYEFMKEAGAKGGSVKATESFMKRSAYSSDNHHIARKDLAYFHYLLAKYGSRNLSHLRYFAHTQRETISKSPLAMVHIGAAYAYHGKAEQTKQWFDQAVKNAFTKKKYKMHFHSSTLQEITDMARIIIETSQSYPQLPKLLNEIAHQANQQRYFSTIEKASFLRLAEVLKEKQSSFSIKIDGNETITQSKAIILEGNKKIYNAGKSPIWVCVSVTGQPKGDEKPHEAGFSLNRTILTMHGKTAPKNLIQGESYIVVLSGKVLDKDDHTALILDLLPAGLEITVEKVNLNNLSEAAGKVIKEISSVTYVEARDDRFMAALDLNSESKFKVCYIARAVTPGKFSHPLSRIEDMYRPDANSTGTGNRTMVITER